MPKYYFLYLLLLNFSILQGNIRQSENRTRNDLRSTIDELNKSTIELQAERNQLLDSLSENEITIKVYKYFSNLPMKSNKLCRI